jgi:putative DNA primase/helicase
VYGDPDAGKSTVIDAIVETLGDYCDTTALSTFAGANEGGNRPGLAKLRGQRLIIIPELPTKAVMEADTLKAWTGGDRIEATAKYAHPITFSPQGTIFMVGNKLPGFDFEDEGLWIRVLIVPFINVIPKEEQDRELKSRFDKRGILSWIIEGHRMYREQGINPPKIALEAREEYQKSQDPLRDFWETRVRFYPEAKVPRRDLYQAYWAWAIDEHVPERVRMSQSKFSRMVLARGDVTGVKIKGERFWRGVDLIPLDE